MGVLGQGVAQDDVTAYAWYWLAASQDAQFAEACEQSARNLTPDQIEDAQRLAQTLTI